MADQTSHEGCQVIGGVDTHKDLHVAAVVDEHDHVLGREFFRNRPVSTTLTRSQLLISSV